MLSFWVFVGGYLGQDTLVIIMQYCEGGDLATYIKEGGVAAAIKEEM